MSAWQEGFLTRCCDGVEGVAVGDGAFGPGPALWVGRREVAHFDDDRTLDVRLTKAEIRERRDELKADERVTLRRSTSDWIEVAIPSEDDEQWAMTLVMTAVRANRPTAPAGLPPTGAELERRRRFH